jgi:outer membrane immunogenic protein
MLQKKLKILVIFSIVVFFNAVNATTTPPYNWTGLYAGTNLGYDWGRNTHVVITVREPPNTGIGDYLNAGNNVYPNLNPQGVLGGAQLGFDKQSGNWLMGVVTDFQETNTRAGASANRNAAGIIPGAVVPSTQSLSQVLDYLGTLRGRAGWTIDNWLFYGTAGVSYGSVKSTINFDLSAYGSHPAIFQSGNNTQFLMGWVAGAGVNYGWMHWALGLEYLHYDLGTSTVNTSPYFTNGGAAIITATQNVTGDTLRAVLNYRF